MVLNDAKAVYYGEQAIRRIMLGQTLIWEKYTGTLPYQEGILGYFDHETGVTAEGWTNQAEGADIIFSGDVTHPDDRVQIPAGASGVFPCGTMPEQFTVYLIARADCTGIRHNNRGQFFLSNLEIMSGTTGFEVSTGWDEFSRPAFRSANGRSLGTMVPGNAFHVFAAKIYGRTGRCFVDGKLAGMFDYYPSRIQSLYLGRRPSYASDFGTAFRFFAFAEGAHPDAQMIRNSRWLMQKYGIAPLSGFRFLDYVNAWDPPAAETGLVLFGTDFRCNTVISPDALPEAETPVMWAGDQLKLTVLRDENGAPCPRLKAGAMTLTAAPGTLGALSRITADLTANSSYLMADGALTFGEGADAAALSGGSCKLFGSGFRGKIAGLQLCTDGIIQRDYLPAVRNYDGAAGLFDFVTHTFLTGGYGEP